MQFSNRYQRAVEKLLGHATRRRYYYELGLAGIRVILNEGWGSFSRKFKHYWQMRRYHSRTQAGKRLTSQVREEIFQLTQSEFKPIGKDRVAVVIHAYYADLFDEICACLKNIPVKHTLLVSVTSTKDKTAIAKQVEQIPLVKEAIIKVVENRGRNIAPMLVDFSTYLRQFDYICHIHTKKSLDTPAHNEWRKYLYKMLLGSEERVKAILSVFKLKPSAGIIYPEIYFETPYWVFTWLNNKNIAPAILSRLGARFDPDEYFDFPNGSMFWARREALEPLLNLRLSKDDFPEEHGQRDGTLQHTIERVFVTATRQAGFDQIIIKDSKEHKFSNYSSKNFQQYSSSPFAKTLRSMASRAEVVSFDIFDTLLTRPFATPDMVFRYLEERIMQQYNIGEFYKLRKEAERAAREQKKSAGDVKISEIYDVLAKNAKVSTEKAGKLLSLELEMEKALLMPRPDVVTAAAEIKNSGKRVVLISDTYLEKKHMEEILRQKNVVFYDELYLSCEVGKRKDRGELYEHILGCEGVHKDSYLHIGDNEQSDVQVLVDRGFKQYIHVMKPSALIRFSELGEILYHVLKPYSRWRENLLYGMIANRYCRNPSPSLFYSEKEPLEEPFALGYTIFGPLVFNFILWLIKESANDHIKSLKFVTREGFVLNKVFQSVVNHPCMKDTTVTLPRGDYLLCSRRAAIFANLQAENIEPLLERHFDGTLQSFFDKRLCVDNMDEVQNRLGVAAVRQTVSLPKDYKRVSASIMQVIDVLVEQAEHERAAMIEYCATEGLKKGDAIGLVDLGYSGSIQKALSQLLDEQLAGYYFVTDNMAKTLNDSGAICRGYFGELVDPYTTDLPVYRFRLLFEAVLAQPQGQLINFSRNPDGIIIPRFKKWDNVQKQFSKIEQVQDGILKFICDMLDIFGHRALGIEFPKDVVQRLYEMLLTGELSTGALSRAFVVEDDYCGCAEISVLDFYARQIHPYNIYE